jgi:ribonucleotide reductase alpha subunit
MQRFYLSDNFIEKYKDIAPNWGPLGEFVYLRTYSRVVEGEDRNESWWETVKRVVEGSFNVQKEHCAKLRLPWKNAKAQHSAQVMYDKIFNFKFLPPGRGLWMMGTDFIDKRGGAALNNCAFVSTEDINVKGSFPFAFTMDALMLGVGVGFDTKGAGRITIKQPKNGEGSLDYTIPDSREGWVEGLELLLDAFFYGRKMPKFNFELIRPYGEPIKGFGGTASGPGPLKEMYENIKSLLTDKVGEQLESTDIVDIMNMIGVCVVAGNVRRSAEIAIGEHDDKSFIKMKDYNLFPKEVVTHRWASNNSVFAEVGKTDYSKFAEGIALNGEPGIVWLDNARKYSRLNDKPTWADKHARGVNPCITGDAVIETTEGRFTIADMVADKRDFDVYSMNSKGELEIKPASNIVFTKRAYTIVTIKLSNGKTLECTPDHKIFVVEKETGEIKEIEAQKLLDNRHKKYTPIVLQRIKKGEKYLRVKLNSQTKYTPEHRFVAGAYTDIDSKDIHHINENTFDNRTDNLEVLSHKDHSIKSNVGHNDWGDRDKEGKFVSKIDKIKKESINAPEELLTRNGPGTSIRFDNVTVRETDIPVYDMTVLDNHNFIANGMVVHNCGEQTLESYELCCLVETFPSLHESYDEYKQTLKYAYLYAKSVTLIATHWEETNAVMMKNRRIGTSQSGIIDAFVKHGRRDMLEWCDDGYNYLKELDELYSNWLCIPRSVKITSVKPSGTTSQLPGVSPGIHYPHDEYYIRRVRVASNSPMILPMRVAGYNIVPEVAGTEETRKNTVVIEFPVQEKDFSRRKNDVTIWEQVKNAVDYQRFWADNNVSITVTFNKGESGDVQRVLEAYEDQLKAISFLPISEHGYELAPYESIDEKTFIEMSSKLSKPDFSHITSIPEGEKYCDGDACDVIGE